MSTIVERNTGKIAFVLSCYDRIVISGTLVDVGHSKAMTCFIRGLGLRIFDYPSG